MTSDYPDPRQLMAFAREPQVFSDIDTLLTEPDQREVLVAKLGFDSPDNAMYPGKPVATFHFEPAYINIEVERDEWERADDLEVGMTHSKAWAIASDIEVGSDYIVAVGFIDYENRPALCEAYWLLDHIKFETAAIDRDR